VGRDYSLFNETGVRTKTIWQTIKNLPDSSSSVLFIFILPFLAFHSSHLLSFRCPSLRLLFSSVFSLFFILSIYFPPPFPFFLIILYFLLFSCLPSYSFMFLLLFLSSSFHFLLTFPFFLLLIFLLLSLSSFYLSVFTFLSLSFFLFYYLFYFILFAFPFFLFFPFLLHTCLYLYFPSTHVLFFIFPYLNFYVLHFFILFSHLTLEPLYYLPYLTSQFRISVLSSLSHIYFRISVLSSLSHILL